MNPFLSSRFVVFSLEPLCQVQPEVISNDNLPLHITYCIAKDYNPVIY